MWLVTDAVLVIPAASLPRISSPAKAKGWGGFAVFSEWGRHALHGSLTRPRSSFGESSFASVIRIGGLLLLRGCFVKRGSSISLSPALYKLVASTLGFIGKQSLETVGTKTSWQSGQQPPARSWYFFNQFMNTPGIYSPFLISQSEITINLKNKPQEILYTFIFFLFVVFCDY